jgi:hypothetical protein
MVWWMPDCPIRFNQACHHPGCSAPNLHITGSIRQQSFWKTFSLVKLHINWKSFVRVVPFEDTACC